MKRITGKQVADALGWHYHDKPKESRRVMCDAAAETLNALAAACSYESAHMLLREARDLLEAAEFKESENAIAAQDVRERISIELGEWNADFEPNKSEGAPIRENGGRAETDTPPRTATPSDPSTAWTDEHLRAATDVAVTVAFWKERADDREIALTCAEIAKHAHLFTKRTISANALERMCEAEHAHQYPLQRDLPFREMPEHHKARQRAALRAALSAIGIEVKP